MESLFNELIDGQRAKMRSRAEQLLSNITDDDLLQPMDFPELESDPLFRYEEGVLEGLLTARAAWRCLSLERPCRCENQPP